MKTTLLSLICVIVLSAKLIAQNSFLERNGNISFFSKAPAENIEAQNHEVSSVLNIKTGELAFSVLIKSFKFRKALMQAHFNESYLESDKYPKSKFTGSITNLDRMNFNKNGVYPVVVEGNLTMHGVTRKIKSNATITVTNLKINATADFQVNLKDYNIKIPAIVRQKIAEVIDVRVSCNYQPYQP